MTSPPEGGSGITKGLPPPAPGTRLRHSVHILRIVFIAAAAVLTVSSPAPASADAELVGSGPRQGSTVSSLPAEIVIELDETVRRPASLVLTDQYGDRVNQGGIEVNGRTVSSATVNDAHAGQYTLNYSVVSADSHRVAGSVTFSVEEGSARTDLARSVVTMPDEPANVGSYTIFVIFCLGMVALGIFIRAGMRSARATGEGEDT